MAGGWFYSCYSHLEHRASVKSVGLLGRVISPSQGRYLTHTSMPRVGIETTIPEFERVKTVHALDRAATVIGKGNAMPATGRGGP
jgi:hypothetical protein